MTKDLRNTWSAQPFCRHTSAAARLHPFSCSAVQFSASLRFSYICMCGMWFSFAAVVVSHFCNASLHFGYFLIQAQLPAQLLCAVWLSCGCSRKKIPFCSSSLAPNICMFVCVCVCLLWFQADLMRASSDTMTSPNSWPSLNCSFLIFHCSQWSKVEILPLCSLAYA